MVSTLFVVCSPPPHFNFILYLKLWLRKYKHKIFLLLVVMLIYLLLPPFSSTLYRKLWLRKHKHNSFLTFGYKFEFSISILHCKYLKLWLRKFKHTCSLCSFPSAIISCSLHISVSTEHFMGPFICHLLGLLSLCCNNG